MRISDWSSDVCSSDLGRGLVISTRAEDGVLEVAICDTGPGIAPEIAERLFTPFVTSKQDGMGIGLSISRSLVESHDGSLWAEAKPEGGTVFRFRLPGQPARKKPTDEHTGEAAGPRQWREWYSYSM